MRLTEPVDFDSSDGHSVDLIFGLMVRRESRKRKISPTSNMLTSLLRDEALCARLRAATIQPPSERSACSQGSSSQWSNSRAHNRADRARRKPTIIVSGLSGSGKSVALHALEDLGYYCIDNMPAGLLRHCWMK